MPTSALASTTGRRQRPSVVLAAALGVAVLALPVAAAAAPAALGGQLGAGSVPIARCGDLTQVDTEYTVVAGLVTSVVLTSFPAGCIGASVQVTFSASSGTALVTLPAAVLVSTRLSVPTGATPLVPSAIAYVNLYAVGP